MKSALLPLLATLGAGLAGPALGQEVIQAGPQGPAPKAEAAAGTLSDPEQSPEAIGAWARAVLAGRPTAEAEADAPSGRSGHLAQAGRTRGCSAPEDHRPHGAVWGGIGTRGYREVGGSVSQAVGDCGRVSVTVDKTEGEIGGWRRR